MKIALRYLNDGQGNVQAVQLPVTDWEKLMVKLKKYEQALKLQMDLKEASKEVAFLKSKKGKKETLSEFLDEL